MYGAEGVTQTPFVLPGFQYFRKAAVRIAAWRMNGVIGVHSRKSCGSILAIILRGTSASELCSQYGKAATEQQY